MPGIKKELKILTTTNKALKCNKTKFFRLFRGYAFAAFSAGA